MSVKNSSNNSGALNKCVVGNFLKKLINTPQTYTLCKLLILKFLNHNLIFGHQMAIISMENKRKILRKIIETLTCNKNVARNKHVGRFFSGESRGVVVQIKMCWWEFVLQKNKRGVTFIWHTR